MTFDPFDLAPEATLNRTVSRSGRRTGVELLGADALKKHGADEAGRRLAALLAALATSDPSDGLGLEAAPWRRKYLAVWRTRRVVWLGGGTAADFGSALVHATNRRLASAGVDALRTRAAAHPQHLPLIGAARSAQTTAPAAAVFDFGHTYVKRGVARYGEFGTLERIDVLRTAPVNVDRPAADFVFEVLRRTAREIDASSVVISVASYVRRGVPDRDRGYHSPLAGQLERVAAVAAECGMGVPLWLHDATAAARAVASASGERAVVLTLGTSIGVAFVPDAGDLRPLASDLNVKGESSWPNRRRSARARTSARSSTQSRTSASAPTRSGCAR